MSYGDLWSLDLWSSDWFGDASGSKLHTVTEGRWAYLEVPKASSDTRKSVEKQKASASSSSSSPSLLSSSSSASLSSSSSSSTDSLSYNPLSSSLSSSSLSSSLSSSFSSSSSKNSALYGNALGFLRALWNLNSSPYVTR